MNGPLLERQSWETYLALSKQAYSHSLFELGKPGLKNRRQRLLKVSERAFLRWERRMSKLYNYNPDGVTCH